ncbi:putative Sgf11, transcriptional regulation protein [Trachipleistophora hominis]|uniref:Putative Sgf11, transcriptional regulation protein n=1 Tax=Trachipleistophora hominis TaxID=72359 RepID=L7JXD1_TRAHO|nr:putative Sgf11, transcriptional regulation protein [Trachipleistophora hominis]
MTHENEPDYKAVYDLILKEYAFNKAFTHTYESNHLCCGYKHKEFSGNIVSNIKCHKCGKYAPAKRFTSHMERCMKK